MTQLQKKKFLKKRYIDFIPYAKRNCILIVGTNVKDKSKRLLKQIIWDSLYDMVLAGIM